MGLEVATFPADLVQTNPPTSDLETQGANHIQLLKTVIQNCWGTSVRRYVGLQGVLSLNASTFLTSTQAGSMLILVNTGAGPITLTMPSTLVGSDAGWECTVMKISNDVNPIFIAPPAGTIQSGEYSGLSKTRRCFPGKRTRVFWTGTGFFCERILPQPIGAVIPTQGISPKVLPVGYEWPSGQVLSSSANYPDYFALYGSGTTPDYRGRSLFGRDDMGGSAASRITAAGGNFDGTAQFGVGGLENHVMTNNDLFPHAHTGSGNVTDPQHKHTGEQTWDFTSTANGHVAIGGTTAFNTHDTPLASTGITVPSLTLNNTGGGLPFTILPPTAIVDYLLIVE